MLLLELLMPQRFYNLEVDIDQLLLLESSIVQCLNFQHTVLLLLNDEPYRNQQINISRHLYANCLEYAYKEMERIWKCGPSTETQFPGKFASYLNTTPFLVSHKNDC